MILYSNSLAIRRELAEVQQSLGTASYQIGEELVVRLFSNILPPRRPLSWPQDNIKKYSRLILLSPSIFHYKGSIPKDYMVVSGQSPK